MKEITCVVGIFVVLMSMTGSSIALSGGKICTRRVSKLVYDIKTSSVGVRKCTTGIKNGKRVEICQTQYSLRTRRTSSVVYKIEMYCCPEYIEVNNTCVQVTTTTSTEATTTELSTEATTSPVIPPPARPLQEEETALSLTGTAGIALGGAAILLVVLIVVIFVVKRNRQKKDGASKFLHGSEDTEYDQELNDAYSPVPNLYDQLHLYGNEDRMYDSPNATGVNSVKFSKGRGTAKQITIQNINSKNIGGSVKSPQNIGGSVTSRTNTDPAKPKSDISSQIKKFESLQK